MIFSPSPFLPQSLARCLTHTTLRVLHLPHSLGILLLLESFTILQTHAKVLYRIRGPLPFPKYCTQGPLSSSTHTRPLLLSTTSIVVTIFPLLNNVYVILYSKPLHEPKSVLAQHNHIKLISMVNSIKKKMR